MNIQIDDFIYDVEPLQDAMKELAIDEYYVEHTQVNPDVYSLFQRDIDDESFENAFRIIATNNTDVAHHNSVIRKKKMFQKS
jgi:hypothetical protein